MAEELTPLQKWVKARPLVHWGLIALFVTYVALRVTGVIDWFKIF